MLDERATTMSVLRRAAGVHAGDWINSNLLGRVRKPALFKARRARDGRVRPKPAGGGASRRSVPSGG